MTDISSKLGFVIAEAGLPHQGYLLRRYLNLTSIPKVMITLFGVKEGSRAENGEKPVSLTPASPGWKFIDRCQRAFRRRWKRLTGQHKYVHSPVVGWKSRLHKCIEREHIQALFVCSGYTAISILPELRKLNIPIAVLFEGSDAQMADTWPWYARKLHQVWQISERCIFVCNFLKQQACQRGCPPEKCEVIYNGTPIPDRPIQSNGWVDPKFICVSNLLPVKGHKYLIKAFSLVCDKLNNATLTLVGDGPLRDELTRLVHNLGLDSSVRFLGTVQWDLLQKELRLYHIYVQTSVRTEVGEEEGLPYAAIEAQSLGLPAVVSKSGGLVEAVEDGVTGIVVEQRNIDAIAEAMLRLVNDAGLHRRMSTAAFHRTKQIFDENKQNTAWCETIRRLMQRENTKFQV